MSKKEYFVGVDWAADPPIVSTPLVDAIICDQRVKQRIEEALKGDVEKLKTDVEKQLFPPGVQEVTIPIKVMTVPGMDLSSAYLISPAATSPQRAQYAAMSAPFGGPNRNGDMFRPSLHGGMAAAAMGVAVGGMAGASAMMGASNPFFAHSMAGVGIGNMAGIKGMGPRWGTPRFAEMGERCQTCENALICNVEEVSPVVCAGCKRRYFMYNDCEVETRQICLGFDWEKAKKDYQCDHCAKRVIGSP